MGMHRWVATTAGIPASLRGNRRVARWAVSLSDLACVARKVRVLLRMCACRLPHVSPRVLFPQ